MTSVLYEEKGKIAYITLNRPEERSLSIFLSRWMMEAPKVSQDIGSNIIRRETLEKNEFVITRM